MFAAKLLILVAVIVAISLLPGADALYYKYSTTAGTTCSNQAVGTFASTATLDANDCRNLQSESIWSIGGTEFVNTLIRYTDDLCTSDDVLVIKDAGCNEIFRAAHICLEREGHTYLFSCDNDIVEGAHGMVEIK
jgi:hypothetical protein